MVTWCNGALLAVSGTSTHYTAVTASYKLVASGKYLDRLHVGLQPQSDGSVR